MTYFKGMVQDQEQTVWMTAGETLERLGEVTHKYNPNTAGASFFVCVPKPQTAKIQKLVNLQSTDLFTTCQVKKTEITTTNLLENIVSLQTQGTTVRVTSCNKMKSLLEGMLKFHTSLG